MKYSCLIGAKYGGYGETPEGGLSPRVEKAARKTNTRPFESVSILIPSTLILHKELL